ncbi:MAG: DUF3109 family protein [Candidatus Kapaibacteriales bacterium]
MISVEGIIINQRDLQSPFLCDTKKCRGACCFIEGELGAPLKMSELKIIESNFPKIQHLLPVRSLEIIEKEGPFVKNMNTYYTNVVNRKECVFAFFENGVARCAFETAYNQGLIDFRKPISCHLFPLREYQFSQIELVYTRINECKSAIENGKEKNIALIETLKEALIRRFGQPWFEQLHHALNCLQISNNFGGKK